MVERSPHGLAIKPGHESYLVFGDKIQVESGWRAPQMQFLDSYFERSATKH